MTFNLKYPVVVAAAFASILSIALAYVFVKLLSTSWLVCSIIVIIGGACLGLIFSRWISTATMSMIQAALDIEPGLDARSGLFDEAIIRRIRRTFRNLSEKMEAISNERHYLATILENMMEGVLVLDERGHIKMINESLRRLLMISHDIAGRSSIELPRNAELE